MARERVIVHVDMDAFFAAIEQRDHPEYRGKPVVVGADPKGGKGRGVVSTCSYEARRYGIRSAQPISEAYRRCPHAIFLPVRGEAYAEVSRQILEILNEFTPDMEQVSVDEAFLDVSSTLRLFGTKREMGEEIRRRIEQRTGLTASLGVAPSKMVAKIASEMEKPCGLVIVEPDGVEAFLRPLPVGKLWGVGPKAQKALEAMGIRTIGDLAGVGRGELSERFGRYGEHLHDLARGRDESPVQPGEGVKSVGNEHTFERDTSDPKVIASTLMRLCEKVARRLRESGARGRTVTTKVRLADFTTLTRARTFEEGLDHAPEIYRAATDNLERAEVRGREIRLVGVSVSGLDKATAQQAQLFDLSGRGAPREKWRRLERAIDRIKERYGEDALRHGRSLSSRTRPSTEAQQEQDGGDSRR